MVGFAPSSKPVTLSFFKERCQFKSELLQINRHHDEKADVASNFIGARRHYSDFPAAEIREHDDIAALLRR
jgi:hypothetical protein